MAMIRTGLFSLKAASRSIMSKSLLPATTVFCCCFSGSKGFNDHLKDYVLKQDLQNNFTQYKEAADRKESLRDIFYSDLSNPTEEDLKEGEDDDSGCLLCRIPENLITYTNVGLLRLFIHEGGSMYSHDVTHTCKKHQRKIARCIKHARIAGLLPFVLTPTDYELYDFESGDMDKQMREEENEQPEEPSLSEQLNSVDEDREQDKNEDEVASEDFAKLMDLLSADSKQSNDSVEQK